MDENVALDNIRRIIADLTSAGNIGPQNLGQINELINLVNQIDHFCSTTGQVPKAWRQGSIQSPT